MRSAAIMAATWIVLTGAALLAFPAAVRADAPPAEPLPTAEQLHQLFKDGEYPSLLKKLSRVLQLRGPAAQAYDPVELQLLKADAHLQMKEWSLAVAAAGQAVKAIDDNRTDPREAATARATALLLKRSRQYQFVPKGAGRGAAPPPPVSVLDPAQRTACFAAMFDDDKLDIQAKVRAARTAKTLIPIVDAINGVSELRTLEVAAFGKDEQSVAQLDGLAQQAKDLMVRGIKELQVRQDKINQQASSLVQMGQYGSAYRSPNGTVLDTSDPTYHKKGLTPQQMTELRGIVADCNRIAEAAQQFADVSKATADGFDEVRAAAEKAAKATQDTLDEDYGGVFTK